MALQTLINGLAVGSIYALTAIGYSMVFSILRIINFAHGSFYMVGAVVSLSLYVFAGFPFIFAFLLGIIAAGAIGVSTERIAVRPLNQRRAPRFAFLLSTLGMQLVLDNSARLLWGTRTRPFPVPIADRVFIINNLRISLYEIIIFSVTVILLIGLELFLRRTRTGKAIRATSQNSMAAGLMGINVNQVISSTFAIGAILGGVAGILVGIYYNSVFATMGFVAGMKGFSAAILGGLGLLSGAVVGGFLLGIAENFSTAILGTGLRDITAFSIIIIVLIFKPNGLLGRHSREKV